MTASRDFHFLYFDAFVIRILRQFISLIRLSMADSIDAIAMPQ